MKESYPIYVQWRSVVAYMLDLCSKYPKTVRFSLCDRITNSTLDVMGDIVEAIYSSSKIPILKSANLSLEQLRVLMQISHDCQYISLKQYEYVGRAINDTGKMIGGWLKQCDV